MTDVTTDFLARVDGCMRARLARPDPWLSRVNTHLVGAGGKRVRATLVCWTGEGAELERLIRAAAAVELVHVGTLVHDDVLDRSDTRRGRRAVHELWGNRVAALSGAAIFCLASCMVAELRAARLRRAFTELVKALAEGILHEVIRRDDVDLSIDAYFAIIQKKTASLFAFACLAGAVLAGRPAREIDALRRFGGAFGLVFQMVDDILDVVETAGRPVGTDLRQGFYTVPVLLALRTGDAPAHELRRLIEDGHLAGEGLVRAIALVRSSPGLVAACERARNLGALALATLDDVPSRPLRSALEQVLVARLEKIARIEGEGPA